MKNRGFNFNEHTLTGALLKQVAADLSKTVVDVCQAYLITSTEMRLAERSLKASEELRCGLDAEVFNNHSDQAKVEIYYGRWPSAIFPVEGKERKGKPGFELEEHRKIGARLKQVHADALETFSSINQAYSKQSRPAKGVKKLLEVVTKLRVALDESFFIKHKGAHEVDVYYGANGPPRIMVGVER